MSRPYVELTAGAPAPLSGPLLRPRFTPRQEPAPGAAPRGERPAVRPGGRSPLPAPTSAAAPAGPPARHPGRGARRPAGRADPSARAIIGDEIRIPVMWCQFGSCIARYTHRAALGERDLRARALAEGWRYDALGRLACPDCAQHDSAFWATRAPAVRRLVPERWRIVG